MKEFIRNLIRKVGYDLKKYQSPRGWDSKYLRSLSNANIIIDIGVHTGTPQLYKAFYDRKFILFEPLQQNQKFIEKWERKFDCEVHYLALGNRTGEIEILNEGACSSILSNSNEPGKGNFELVKINKLDNIIAITNNVSKQYAIKIDVEGYELEVLKGASETLKQTDLVIVESSISHLDHYVNDYLKTIQLMQDFNFRLFDILHLAYYKDTKGLMWADFVFVPA